MKLCTNFHRGRKKIFLIKSNEKKDSVQKFCTKKEIGKICSIKSKEERKERHDDGCVLHEFFVIQCFIVCTVSRAGYNKSTRIFNMKPIYFQPNRRKI